MKIFSIVVPVYQNETNLPSTIPALLALGERIPGYSLELVFVDDGSQDRSLEILRQHAALQPSTIKVVKLSRNFGQTPAVQAGLSIASGDCVGIISADLQEPHEVFVDMLRAWEQGARFVMGERTSREEGQFHRTLNGIYWRLIRRLVFPDFPRLGYDFCLLDRRVVTEMNRMNEKNTSIYVLIYWLGYKPVRLPIVRKRREHGVSQWGLLSKVNFTLDTLIGFSYAPARFITFMGFTMGIGCLLYLGLMLANWYVSNAAPPGWMTVVGLLALIGSMTLLSLGIISEYLLRILDEARKRPPYVIEEIYNSAPR